MPISCCSQLYYCFSYLFSSFTQVLFFPHLLHKVPAIVSVWVRLVPLGLISGERVGPFLGLMESGDRRERVNWGQTVRWGAALPPTPPWLESAFLPTPSFLQSFYVSSLLFLSPFLPSPILQQSIFLSTFTLFTASLPHCSFLYAVYIIYHHYFNHYSFH